MAEIKLTIKTGKLELVEDAVCSVYGYEVEIPTPDGPVPNPMSKKQFVKRKLKEFLKNTVRSYKTNIALGEVIDEDI